MCVVVYSPMRSVKGVDENERYIGPSHWRGALNWKDITERILAGFISGTFAGLSFWLLTRLLG